MRKKNEFMAKVIIPEPVKTKIYKTGQTRGADDDVIFQNRVLRNSTVLIPYEEFYKFKKLIKADFFVNGYIVLMKPETYFSLSASELQEDELTLGKNLLVFYETREQWNNNSPLPEWKCANSRKAPLGGEYVARVPSTTSEEASKIIKGFDSKPKGAGIRVYEYASNETIENCRKQLELLFWSCKDIDELIELEGLDKDEVQNRISSLQQYAEENDLFDKKKLIEARIIDKDGFTICPLCLKHISAKSFCSRIIQAEGRDVPDLTVTEVSLFHIHELRSGEFNHKPYNLGWGHHHCNVVVKDAGIEATLQWMREVIRRNEEATL